MYLLICDLCKVQLTIFVQCRQYTANKRQLDTSSSINCQRIKNLEANTLSKTVSNLYNKLSKIQFQGSSNPYNMVVDATLDNENLTRKKEKKNVYMSIIIFNLNSLQFFFCINMLNTLICFNAKLQQMLLVIINN